MIALLFVLCFNKRPQDSDKKIPRIENYNAANKRKNEKFNGMASTTNFI